MTEDQRSGRLAGMVQMRLRGAGGRVDLQDGQRSTQG